MFWFVAGMAVAWTTEAPFLVMRVTTHPDASNSSSAATRAFLLLIVTLPLVVPVCRGISLGTLANALSRQALAAAGAFAILLAVNLGPSPAVWAVFTSAGCEELVFRLILPACVLEFLLRSSLSAGWAVVLACLAAQVSFGVAHGAGSPQTPFDLARLVAAGLFFAELAWLRGLWLAILVHAGTNTLLVEGRLSVRSVSPTVSLVACIAGFALLALHAREVQNVRQSGISALGSLDRCLRVFIAGAERLDNPRQLA